MWKHVGFVLSFSWRKTGKVLLDENCQGIPFVQELLTLDRDLLSRRPCEHTDLRKSHSQHIVGKESGRRDTRGTAFNLIAKFPTTGKFGTRKYESLLTQGINFRLRQSQTD